MAVLRGVYAIICVDGRAYVGGSVHIKKRWNNHRCDLRAGRHHSGPLQAAWRALGEESFSFVLLEMVPNGDLAEAEQRWMDTLNSGFNVAPVAGSTVGFVHTAESRERMSQSRRGVTLSPAAMQKRIEMCRTRIFSPAARAKMSAANTGEKHPGAKLTVESVREIRSRLGKESQSAIAADYGVSRATVSLIATRKVWTSVAEEARA